MCDLDRNTLESIKLLKSHEVKDYFDTFNHSQVNIHLAHTVRDENVIRLMQKMSVDLMSKSYSLAKDTSLRIMKRV